MKNIFTRTTTEKKFEDLNPSFIRNFRKSCETHNLGDIEKDVLRCFETRNEKKGFLGQLKISHTVICATQKMLFWDIIKEKKDTDIAIALFSEIQEVKDYETGEAAKIYQDHGLEFFGFIYKWSRRSSWFIGLGNDTDGEQCRIFLKDLIRK